MTVTNTETARANGLFMNIYNTCRRLCRTVCKMSIELLAQCDFNYIGRCGRRKNTESGMLARDRCSIKANTHNLPQPARVTSLATLVFERLAKLHSLCKTYFSAYMAPSSNMECRDWGL